jgi:hypothetical protein
MIFDTESFVVIPEPMKKIVNLGWTHPKFHRASEKLKLQLLRGKAMSLMAESRGCPILQPLALRLLELTSGSKWRITSSWEQQKLRGSLLTPLPISEASRMIMFNVHGFTHLEQMALEEYFSTISLEPLSHSIITDHLNADQIHYALNFVIDGYDGDRPSFALPSVIYDFSKALEFYCDAKD